MKNIKKQNGINNKPYLLFIIYSIIITQSLSLSTSNKTTFKSKSLLSGKIGNFSKKVLNSNNLPLGDAPPKMDEPDLKPQKPKRKLEMVKTANEEFVSQQGKPKTDWNKASSNENKKELSSECPIQITNILDRESATNDRKQGPESKPNTQMIIEDYFKKEIKSNQIIKSGWLKISSVKFTNPNFFPKMSQGCGKYVKLFLDKDNYLINMDNDDMEFKQLKKGDTKYYFYFRLTKQNLYFTISSTERHILGTLLVMSIISIKPELNYSDQELCFKIQDVDGKNWMLCALNLNEKLEWFCILNKLLGKISTLCMNKKEEEVIETKVEQKVIIVPYPSRICNEKWNYDKHGDDWECECSEGREQSPIDLPHHTRVTSTMIRPVFSYSRVNPVADETLEEFHMVDKENIKIFFKENMIRMYHKEFGRVITNDEIIYIAQEIQFHTPGEHTINGKRYDMEMQVIHNGIENGIGKQLILSFLFIASPGIKNLFLEDLNYSDLPNQNVTEKEIKNQIFISKIFYQEDNNEHSFDFKNFSFYFYEGSLTNPPCAESTLFYVNADPILVSTLTINLFKEALIPSMLRDNYNSEFLVSRENLIANYRNAQNVNGREIFYYHNNEVIIHEEKKTEGHYEMITSKGYEYLYIGSDKPSGIPDSYVVSRDEALNLSKEFLGTIQD